MLLYKKIYFPIYQQWTSGIWKKHNSIYIRKNEIDKKLTKYVQDKCEENYKTLMRDIKKELSKCREVPVYG